MFDSSPLTLLDLEGPDRRHLANRLIRRLNHARRAALGRTTVAELNRLREPECQRRMLFVVGAARSGTTAMQTALNASPEVFLLGEANLFRENLKPGFQRRYNDRQRAIGLPPSKEASCPLAGPETGTWVEAFAGLLSQYRLVGEKVAFGAFQPDRLVSEFLAFHRRHFAEAAYVLMFRNPSDAILSPRRVWGIQQLEPWVMSYIVAVRGLIRMRINFPRTVPVFLEAIQPSTSKAIRECLDFPLPRLFEVLVRKEPSHQSPDQIPPELRPTVADLDALYPELREAIENSGAQAGEGSLRSIDTRLHGLVRRLPNAVASG